MKNNYFNCQIGVNNIQMGKVQITGKHIPKEGKYLYDKFILRFTDKKNMNR